MNFKQYLDDRPKIHFQINQEKKIAILIVNLRLETALKKEENPLNILGSCTMVV